MKLNKKTKDEYIVFAVCVLLAVCFIIYSIRKNISANDRDTQILIRETTLNVSSITTLYNRHLQLLNCRAEELNKSIRSENELLKDRLIDVVGKGWELLPSKDDSSTSIGRLTGLNTVNELSNQELQEIYMAEKLNRIFAQTKKNLPNAPFIYYTSKSDFWNLTPRYTTDFSFFIKDYSNYELFTLGLPENNPTRRVFWTKPYIDAGGKGLMVSAGIPVYNHNQFIGTICIDMLFNDIANYLKSSTFTNHNISLIDNYSQVVSSTSQHLTPSNTIPSLYHLINDIRNNIANFDVNKFIWYKDYRIFVSKIPNNSWYILHFETRSKFITKIIIQVLPVFVAVIFLLVIIYLLLYANRLRLENEEARIRAENSNTTKNKFLSIISHDLRGPFNSLLGFADLMDENFKSNNLEDQKRYFGYINEGIRREYKLLDDLLLWAKLQREGIVCNPEKLELNIVIDESIEPLHQLIQNKSIKLSNQVSKDIFVYSDKSILSTVFRNLVSNAVKFTPRNGTIIIEAIIEEHYISVSVKDDGIGISIDKIGMVFDISKKTSTVGTEGESGSGLGLLLCKELVEQQQGRIWVESEVGIGTTFYFTIPLKKNDTGANKPS